MPAGDNEKLFEELICGKFGSNILSGKRSFSLEIDGQKKAVISVDQSIELEDGSLILTEIDSGNMAKLIAGQYALLNGMYDKDRAKALFLVVHYYTAYNPERTEKNLNAIQHFNRGASWIPYGAYSIEGFKSIIREVTNIDEVVACIWPNRMLSADSLKLGS